MAKSKKKDAVLVIVNIFGGLGNQMFQYAFALSQVNQSKTALDISSFDIYDLRKYELDSYNISLDTVSKGEAMSLKYADENTVQKFFRKLKRKSAPKSQNYYREPHFSYDANVYKVKGDVYFYGYWQSEKYFKDFRQTLLKEFTLKKELGESTKQYEQEIIKNNSVSLHIRRGDYVANPHTNSVHGVCALDYYKTSVDAIEKRVDSPYFFIFSDDLQWAKENLGFIANKVFVGLDDKTPDHEEIYLMSQCQHNIIANSSFSWWGAWLNQNPEKIVIAPKKWFNDTTRNTSDLIPEQWIRL